ncbi:MAG: AMP-binding protein, partial [Methylobacteriaceae bacterium]|nr:AMP-binding protein [Methylobacteriaceae bacterium]
MLRRRDCDQRLRTCILRQIAHFGDAVFGDEKIGIAPQSGDDAGRANLRDDARDAAAGFDALGVGEGSSVALLMRNDFAFFEASLAAVRLGAYAVPINWHFKADEVGYILRDCDARVLVVHADLLPAIQEAIPAET